MRSRVFRFSRNEQLRGHQLQLLVLHGTRVCWRKISCDPILGLISKGQALVVHALDRPQLGKGCFDRDKLLDVPWDPEVKRMVPVRIKVLVMIPL